VEVWWAKHVQGFAHAELHHSYVIESKDRGNGIERA
jgi:hypothetical protein